MQRRLAPTVYADHLLTPWLQPLTDSVSPEIFDCHTHVGSNDPSGFAATADELLDCLDIAGCRAAVFPLKEPEGYATANRRATSLADQHRERLIAFARIEPGDRPLDLAQEGLAAGARGIKLHPASDEFDIGDPRLDEVYRLADGEQLPVLIHAGPEVQGVGETALSLCRRFPNARLILAHDALTDLSWIYEHVEEVPNLYFDTSWWGPVHTMALFALVPPGRILNASDLPYCTPLSGAITTLRCGIQAGLGPDALRGVLGGQFAALVEGEDPPELGPAPGPAREPLDPLLERIFVTLLTGLEALQRGDELGNAMPVTRHALKVPPHHPRISVFRSVGSLLDLYDAHADELEARNQYSPGWDLIAMAALVARTPDAPLPELP